MKTNEIDEQLLRVTKALALVISLSTSSSVLAVPVSENGVPWRTPTAQLVQYEAQSIEQSSLVSIQQLYRQKRIRHMEFVI